MEDESFSRGIIDEISNTEKRIVQSYPIQCMKATCCSSIWKSYGIFSIPNPNQRFRFSMIQEHSFPRPGETKNHVVQKSTGQLPTSKMIPRRLILHSFGFIPVLSNVPLISQALEMNEPEVIRTQKLDSGVRIQDIIDGEGKEAREGDLVEVNYVCRRSNGYFVHSTVDQFSGESSPVILPLNEREIIKGLKEVIVGMKAGGKRRALIPPSVGYVNENLGPIPDEFGPRRSLLSHVKEPLIFEVQLLKVL